MNRARYGPGDIQIARLVARRTLRRTLYAVFLVTAAAGLFLRVGQGRSVQVLPSWLALLGLYGILMAVVSRDPRVRSVWIAFGMLVAASFSRGPGFLPARLVGGVEVVAACACVVLLWSIARDDRFLAHAVIDFAAPRKQPPDGPGPSTGPRDGGFRNGGVDSER